MKASTETRTFSTQKNHEKKTNFFYPTHCKTITSLVSLLDCMSLPMMPSYLMLVEAITETTIVDIVNFQPFLFSRKGFTGNCSLFKNLAIANFWQSLSPCVKLNACNKRKTEYFSFLKHPFRQIFTNTACKTSIKMTDYPKLAVATATAAATTASEQQTGVRIRINE